MIAEIGRNWNGMNNIIIYASSVLKIIAVFNQHAFLKNKEKIKKKLTIGEKDI
jgi:hypothetical protein